MSRYTVILIQSHGRKKNTLKGKTSEAAVLSESIFPPFSFQLTQDAHPEGSWGRVQLQKIENCAKHLCDFNLILMVEIYVISV